MKMNVEPRLVWRLTHPDSRLLELGSLQCVAVHNDNEIYFTPASQSWWSGGPLSRTLYLLPVTGSSLGRVTLSCNLIRYLHLSASVTMQYLLPAKWLGSEQTHHATH